MSNPPPNETRAHNTSHSELAEEKLRLELADLRRPYLLRNPQLLIALITSVGAIIGVSLLISDNYFKVREERNDLQAAKTERLNEDSQKELTRAKERTEEAAKITGAAAQAEAQAQVAIENAKRVSEQAAQTVKNAEKEKRQAVRAAQQAQTDAAAKIAAANAEVESAAFDRPLTALIQRGAQATPDDSLVSPLIRLLQEGGPRHTERVNAIQTIIAKPDTPAALKASLLYVLLKGDREKNAIDDLAELLESSMRSWGVDARRARNFDALSVRRAITTAQWTDDEREYWLVRSARIIVSANNYGVSTLLATDFLWWTKGVPFRLTDPAWNAHRDLFLSVLKVLRNQTLKQGDDLFLGEAERPLEWIPSAGLVYIATLLSEHRFARPPNYLLDLDNLRRELWSCACPIPGEDQQWQKWLQDNSYWVSLWQESDLETFRKDPEKLNMALLVWQAPTK